VEGRQRHISGHVSAHSNVKNKARLTGQIPARLPPGGDFPATGRPPGAEALAVAEPAPPRRGAAKIFLVKYESVSEFRFRLIKV
jgi:hypothetical protein